MHYKKKRGFTLIELLISIVIFSLMIGIATYSFSLYVDIIRKSFDPYPENAYRFSELQDSIRSMFYYVGEKKDIVGDKKFFLYFFGKPNSMVFVSAQSAFKDNNLTVSKIFIEEHTLVLEECNIYSCYNDYKNPNFVKGHTKKIIIGEHVKDINIFYFVDGKQERFLKDKIPNLIRMEIEFDNKKKYTWYFKVMSDFLNKKAITGSLYAHF